MGEWTRRQLLETGGATTLAAVLGSAAAAKPAGPDPTAADPTGAGAKLSATAWEAFTESLRRTGAAVAATEDPLDRAEGMRALTRYLSFGFDRFLEFADPERPVFFEVQSTTRKYAGDNPDQRYHTASVRGGRGYRIVGNRGNGVLIEIGLYAGDFSGGGERRLVAHATEESLEFAADGSIEVTVSPDAPPAGVANWLQSAPDASSLLVREYFADPLDKRSSWSIQAVPSPDPAPELDEERLARSLGAVAAFADTLLLWGRWLEGVKARGTNVLNPLSDEGDLQTPGGVRYHEGHWKIGAGEALVVEFQPPEVPYWGFLIMNRWMESLEYRDRVVSRNSFQAERGRDGRVRLVVAHADPGVPNWIDTAGHHEGLMSLRWARVSGELPAVTVRRVEAEALAEETE